MCGICGFIGIKDLSITASTLAGMTASLAHRGPDGRGIWQAPDGRIGLGHTRLSIIDLEGGGQPMKSADGRFVIVFNGEIYNFEQLRRDLTRWGHSFVTRSDTEVILEAYRRWDTHCLERFRGMFAFALYDTRERKLFLARDRTGIKPLYYHQGTAIFYFGSELKALLSVSAVPRRLDYQALADFLRLGYPLLPATMFACIRELEPGSWIEVTADLGIRRGRFWDWTRNPAPLCEEEALGLGEQALTESLQDHLVSDVPIGAFLSGGIDSSLLAALLVKKLGVQIHTFHVRFGEAAYDESAYARAVAAQVSTRHHEIVVDVASNTSGRSEEALELADRVLTQFDQPFGDSSAIPTYLVCKEIRKHVKVALSGDGGDEMFGGYPRFWHADVTRRLATMPAWLRRALTQASMGVRPFAPDRFREVQRLLNAASANGDCLLSICSYAARSELPTILEPDAFQHLMDYEPAFCVKDHGGKPSGEDLIDCTVRFTLPGDYLRKVDVMSSAHGLEVRVPFLGEPVLDCASRLPNSLKYRGARNKLLLRKLAARYLPPKVAAKPKWGFGIPIDAWLGRAGRAAVRARLDSAQAGISAVVRRTYSSPLLESFVSGQWDRSALSRFGLYQRVYALWSLQSWLDRWRPSL
jgi:asparagine synthase (glutamine-hydrolysing)